MPAWEYVKMESEKKDDTNHVYDLLNERAIKLIPRIQNGDEQAKAELFGFDYENPFNDNTNKEKQYRNINDFCQTFDFYNKENSLASMNISFIYKTIKKHAPDIAKDSYMKDLVQDSVESLLLALPKFIPDQFHNYIGYAISTIKYSLKRNRKIYESAKTDDNYPIIKKVTEQIIDTYRRTPSYTDIANELGKAPSEIVSSLTNHESPLSIDEPVINHFTQHLPNHCAFFFS